MNETGLKMCTWMRDKRPAPVPKGSDSEEIQKMNVVDGICGAARGGESRRLGGSCFRRQGWLELCLFGVACADKSCSRISLLIKSFVLPADIICRHLAWQFVGLFSDAFQAARKSQ